MAAFNVTCSICEAQLQTIRRQYHLLHPTNNNGFKAVQVHLAKHHPDVWREVNAIAFTDGLHVGATKMREFVHSVRID